MSVSIYCSPTHLKVVAGKVSGKSIQISDFSELPLPEGAMINGIITNEATMIAFLKAAGDKMGITGRDAHLVIDNNNIRSKVMNLPPVSEEKLLEFIGRDLGQFGMEQLPEVASNDVFDFAVLDPKAKEGGVKVLAVAVGREQLETYRAVLEQAGFNLKSIDIGANAQIKLAAFVPDLSTGTYILAQVDNRNLALTLFAEGQYHVANKYRLMNEQGSLGWYSEIGTNISSMIQFNKGQHGNSEIFKAFFAGLESIDLTEIKSSLSYLGVEIDEIDLQKSVFLTSNASGKQAEFNPGSFLLNLGAMLKK